MTANKVSAARRGRRPGASTTRQAILDAARVRFATDGFATTTIRRVAADAGVDAALVMQFFGSKNELFAAVMSISPAALTHFSAAFEGPDDSLGQRVVRAFLLVWEGSQDSEPLMAMLRAAVVNEEAAAQLREFIQSRLIDGMAARPVISDDAALRAGLASAMLVGLVIGRRIVGVPIVAAADVETVISLVAPAIQSLLV